MICFDCNHKKLKARVQVRVYSNKYTMRKGARRIPGKDDSVIESCTALCHMFPKDRKRDYISEAVIFLSRDHLTYPVIAHEVLHFCLYVWNKSLDPCAEKRLKLTLKEEEEFVQLFEELTEVAYETIQEDLKQEKKDARKKARKRRSRKS
jgi:hypothetical protein